MEQEHADCRCSAAHVTTGDILDCQAAGDPIDVVTVSIHQPALPGGASMLAHAAEVHSKAQGTSSWKTYARVIRERSVLRQVVAVAESNPPMIQS